MHGSAPIGQDLDAQLAALRSVGVEPDRVFTDKLSGSAKADRPGLAALLDYARAGDTVVVTAIDRLGRSVAEVSQTIAEPGERRILLRALREGIDTATPAGRAVAAITATLAELELELGKERRASSRDARRARIGVCRLRSHRSSPPSAKSSYAGWPSPLANLCGSWPLRSGLVARPPTATWPKHPRSVPESG